MTICAPYEPYVCIRNLERNMFGLYNRGMGYNLAKKVQEHRRALEPLEKRFGISIDESIKRIHGLREFDREFTVYIHGFPSPDAYYRLASLGQHLLEIRIPTLLISATDDPVIP